MSKIQSIMAAISAAVSSGNMSPIQANQMKAQLGITQAYFTRKTVSATKRKRLRDIQKASRKRNRGKTRGQSCRKGQRFSSAT